MEQLYHLDKPPCIWTLFFLIFIIDFPQEGRATPSSSAVLGQPVEELKQAADHLPGIKKLM